MNKKTRLVTRTAMLLAVAVLFQTTFRAILPEPTVNVFVVGSLVNAVLIIAASTTGMAGGLAVSVFAPVIALLQGHIAFVWMAPAIAAGNAILVVLYGMLENRNKYIGLAMGSVAKFAFLYAAIKILFKVFAGMPAPVTVAFLFSWPQLVTALTGGFLAFGVLRLLDKHVDYKL